MRSDGELLARFIERAGSVTALTGAGVSTASGIPEYRDQDGNWKHAKPVQFNDFRARERVRSRYWARSFAGWHRVNDARPNRAHNALAGLEQAGLLKTLITQNVDGLHHRAGSQSVIDLHGRLDAVRCLSCDVVTPRGQWQQRLLSGNPNWRVVAGGSKPDGDVQMSDVDSANFSVPDCDACGGIVKPDVVFFGEPVPQQRVAAAKDALAGSGALLIVGSSLMVFSGFRFARFALEFDKPIAIVNQGRTRADDLAHMKFDGDCGDVLDSTLKRLNLGAASRDQRQ
jgi:NAD-dependent SIR2 family protein deacetylase